MAATARLQAEVTAVTARRRAVVPVRLLLEDTEEADIALRRVAATTLRRAEVIALRRVGALVVVDVPMVAAVGTCQAGAAIQEEAAAIPAGAVTAADADSPRPAPLNPPLSRQGRGEIPPDAAEAQFENAAGIPRNTPEDSASYDL